MYKRQIDDIENIKEIDIYDSNKSKAHYFLNSFLKATKPFSGIYLSDNKVIVSNVFEAITLKGIEYNLKNFNTISEDYSNKEYITEIDLDSMKYDYIFKNVLFSKKIVIPDGKNEVIIEYNVKNENEERIKFGIFPMITYRDMLQMKKANFLKFTKREIDSGLIVNLSISEGKSLKLVCENSKFIDKDVYISNIKYDITSLELVKDTYIEDLFVPCEFEISLKSGETKSLSFSMSLDESKSNITNYYNNINNSDDKYVELQSLKKSLEFLENLSLASLPQNTNFSDITSKINEKNFAMYLNEFLLYIKSIDGMYICLDRFSEACEKLEEYICIIENIESRNIDAGEVILKIKLWTVEMINKLYEKDKESLSLKLKEFIGRQAIDVINSVIDDEYSSLKDIEISALMYNTLKIYENIYGDPTHEDMIENIELYIENKFWNEQRRVLKKNIDSLELTACAEMLYTISLSYESVNKDIKAKLLDTIFRELYTPYGLRTVSRTSKDANSLIYPKYMAHFIKANLSQNGNSYAAKKIAYNLVKDLFADIGKYIQNNIKYVYSEKGINIDYKALDLYTTSEMIRLYTMFM